MPPSFWAVVCSAALAPVLMLVGLRWLLRAVRQPMPRRGFVEIHPAARAELRRLGLTEVEHFLALPGLTISGHPQRNVSRVVLGEGPGARTAFLKCEHTVPLKIRLRSYLAGFGLVSRSMREARTLQALQREGLACPDWLAAGEDAQGRAFLLLGEVQRSTELRDHLRRATDLAGRRRLARALGRELARVHHAGFTHPDLYVNHVRVRPAGDAVVLIDWQRARRLHRLGWRQRGRDLAGLHATLGPEQAADRDRLRCLHAYLAESERLTASTAPSPRSGGWFRRRRFQVLLDSLLHETRRRLQRRHVVEKRQRDLADGAQDWRRLDGEALCISAALADVWPDLNPASLALDRQPSPGVPGLTRCWLGLPGRRLVLLARRTSRAPLTALWHRLIGRRPISPEQADSVLLLRLQRHGIGVPRVLAMGQRAGPGGRLDSFLLTEPPSRTLRLDLWLQRQARQARSAPMEKARRQVLHKMGSLLARLHQACCYFCGGMDLSAVGVPVDGKRARVVLQRIDRIEPSRARRPGRASRDRARLRALLRRAGCTIAEVQRFSLAYHHQIAGQPRREVGAW